MHHSPDVPSAGDVVTVPEPPSEGLLLSPGADPDLTKEHVSTALSTLAMLAVCTGLAWGLWPHLGPWGLCIGGTLLGILVGITDVMRQAPAEPEPERPVLPPPPPGPTDPGNIHISGVRR